MNEEQISFIIDSTRWRLQLVQERLRENVPSPGDPLLHGTQRHFTQEANGEVERLAVSSPVSSNDEGVSSSSDIGFLLDKLRGDALFPARKNLDPHVFRIYDSNIITIDDVSALIKELIPGISNDRIEDIISVIEGRGHASFYISEQNVASWQNLSKILADRGYDTAVVTRPWLGRNQ